MGRGLTVTAAGSEPNLGLACGVSSINTWSRNQLRPKGWAASWELWAKSSPLCARNVGLQWGPSSLWVKLRAGTTPGWSRGREDSARWVSRASE